MSSIGIIFREKREFETLPQNWIPEPLGSRTEVEAIVQKYLAKTEPALSLSLNIEAQEDSDSPRTISVSGVWGEKEISVIKSICEQLSARFYDAEIGGYYEF
jgi:hypothetical protein